jgi:hypothetical protein
MTVYPAQVPEYVNGNLNTDLLKAVGCLTMTIDHIGKIFAPDELLWQVAGRLTFPIFAYCLVVGFLRTKSVERYIRRLAVMAIVSQPFYVLAFDCPFYQPNIFFTLLLGILSLHFFREKNWAGYAGMLLLAVLLPIDYNLMGVCLVNCIYWLRNRKKWQILPVWILLYLVTFMYSPNVIVENLIREGDLKLIRTYSLNLFGVFAFPLLYFHMPFRVSLSRFFFYTFYPAHLLLLFMVRQWW